MRVTTDIELALDALRGYISNNLIKESVMAQRQTCSESNCEGAVRAKGLCDKHYRRLHRYGRTHKVRTLDGRFGNPRYVNWNQMVAAHPDKVCDRWKDDFWAYVEDIGEQPGDGWRLCRKDSKGGFSKENVHWVAPLGAEESRQRNLECMRRWNKEHQRERWLQKRYGISEQDYDAILESQDGVCAICGRAERAKRLSLAVDHDHETGQIRGLLCNSCNTALGKFQDDPEVIESAIRYLVKSRMEVVAQCR